MTIQRLLILHVDLYQLCTGQSQYEEDASDEELAESILYFSTNTTTTNTTTTTTNPTIPVVTGNRSEAIRFAGLATALYTLPASFPADSNNNNNSNNDSYNNNNDYGTHHVHFENGCLVYACLEEHDMERPNNGKGDGDGGAGGDGEGGGGAGGDPRKIRIVAVAQIAATTTTTTTGHRGMPMAVRLAMERTHRLFRLLRGGGIHQRLLQRLRNSSSPPLSPPPAETVGSILESNDDTNHDDTNHDDHNTNSIHSRSTKDCIYAGMDQLYAMHKQMRQWKQRQRRPGAADETTLRAWQTKLDQWYATSPMAALKRDLGIHYDAFLTETATFTHAAAFGTFYGIFHGLAPAAAPPHAANPFFYASLDRALRRLFPPAATAVLSHHGPHIVAVTTLAAGHCLGTHTHPDGVFPSFRSPESNGLSSLLWCYFSSVRHKMLHQRDTTSGSRPSSSSRPSLPTTLALSSWKDQGENPLISSSSLSSSSSPVPSSSWLVSTPDYGFLPAPPLSLLSALDDASQFFHGPNGQQLVWAPRIFWPSMAVQERRRRNDQHNESSTSCRHCAGSGSGNGDTPGTNNVPESELRVAKYNYDEWSFLVFFTRPITRNDEDNDNDNRVDAENDDKDAFVTVFQTFDDVVRSVFQGENGGRVVTPLATVHICARDEPGQDIIIVNRKLASTTTIVSDRMEHPRNPLRGENQPSIGPPSKASFFLDPRGAMSRSRRRPINPSDKTQQVGEWDGRQLLALGWSFDAILAFDDVLTELRHRTTTRPEERNAGLELCTMLTDQWMYGYAEHDYELYVRLDAKLYATLADVEAATRRIRSEFLNNKSLAHRGNV